MYSVDENKDNNSTPDADRKRYPSKPQSDTTDSMVDMIMGASTGSNANSGEAQQTTVDAKTLITQTQDRMWKALKRRYQYDSNLNPAQTFLLNHINSKIPLVIMYVDLVGITQDKEVVAYCRIGERSSHTWFVLKYLLGYPNVKNYDGSWTEWGNMINNPVEK